MAVANLKARSRITGAHMKVGWAAQQPEPGATTSRRSCSIGSGVPISDGPMSSWSATRRLLPQDQWTSTTLRRSALRLHPDQLSRLLRRPTRSQICYPARSTEEGVPGRPDARIGAYDLFGNGKTAVKFNVGRCTALTASNSDMDLNR
jgi:hypothetical protein